MKASFRNSGLALALVLEIIALALTIGADKSKRIFAFNSVSQVLSRVYTVSFQVQNYFYLAKENRKLIEANRELLANKVNCHKLNDTIYSLIFANVVKNSINHANNLLIISAGSEQGVEPEDGVISASGNIVGMVISVEKNYSSVLSVLNNITSISVLHKKTNTMGELTWENIKSPRYMSLSGIPTYVNVAVGDTIITSGYSQIFPKGITVGTVYSIKKTRTSNTYDIKVLLAEDMSSLQYVFVVKNHDKKQIKAALEKANKILSLE